MRKILKACLFKNEDFMKAYTAKAEDILMVKRYKKAFTLAEVLITIAIIGIVAMLVIPQLIANYKRHVAGAKLKKFYYTVNEALAMAKIENGKAGITLNTSGVTGGENINLIDPWYRKNVTNYMKTTKIEGIGVNKVYFRAAFVDGSGFNSYMDLYGRLHIFYCLNFSKCVNDGFDGENQFLFQYSPSTHRIEAWKGWNGITHVEDLDGAKVSCLQENKGLRHGCTLWIALNGWEIPKDYPWIK